MNRPPSTRPNLGFAFESLVGQEVWVNIRIFQLYLKGVLKAFDEYSNILIENATEYEKDAQGAFVETAKYPGPVLVRGEGIVNVTKTK